MIAIQKSTLLHLFLIDQVGPATISKILESSFDGSKFSHQLEEIYNFSISDISKKFGLSLNIAKTIFDGLCDKKLLDEEIELIFKNKIDLISILDDEYPFDLANIHLPPTFLYCKGLALSSYEKKIAIVGSRNSTNYGREVIESFLPPLLVNGWTIVSGGALGIDTIAHKTSINLEGKTIAVLGSGLLSLYPSENIKLFNEIANGKGTLLSIFPMRTKPFKGNFPARNRVISGLSSGCIVVQAAQKSGALITAHYALEQGRGVFAVPGSIFDDLSMGCNKLIMQGAKPVTSVWDILEDFGECGGPSLSDVHANEEPLQIKAEEDPFLVLLQKPISIDELSIKSGQDVFSLQEKLFDMQLEGSVEQDFVGLWKRV